MPVSTPTSTMNAQPPALRIELRECPRGQQLMRRREMEEGKIHIWHASPGWHYPELDPLTILSEDERDRMARFRFPSDQNNFLSYRSTLRILLASYFGATPAELRFAYSTHGKPNLAAPLGDLKFNLSHTQGLVLFAVCRGKRIGVDIERIRKDFDVMEIARRFFSVSENRAIAQMPQTSSYQAFFHCWTRKEAFVKARGEGLSFPLDNFDVSVAPEDEEVSLRTRPHTEAQLWKVHSLNFFPGYAAALAVQASDE